MNGGRLPDFVIIGAMKAATSTLHMQLAAQPGIFMADPKEPNFFSDDAIWQRGLDWYRALFATAPANAICGEASTHYAKLPTYPDSLPRLHDTMADARLIYMMRHPIDRLVSHYSHGWLERSITGPIDDAITSHPELVDYGCYAMQIAPWLDAFGKDKILPVFMERMIAAPQLELERICHFIGYRDTPTWQEAINLQNASGERLRDSPWRDRIVNHPATALIRRHVVPQSVRNYIKRGWQMRQKPVISASIQAQLTSVFDDDLAQLGTMLGTELNCSIFKEMVRGGPLHWA